MLNLWTWNVYSIKNKVHHVNQLLIKHDIDILLLTETKLTIKNQSNIVFHNDYKWVFNSNKTSYYHGIAFIYKKDLDIKVLNTELPQTTNVKYEGNNVYIKKYIDQTDYHLKAHQTEGRLLTLLYKDIVIVGTYVPNSGVDRQEKLKRLAYRTLKWDPDMVAYLLSLQYEKVIWLGDLNVAIEDHDTLNTKVIMACLCKEERDNIKTFIQNNHWIDTWHELNKEVKKCKDRATWGIHTKFPLRLDYILCSPHLKDNLVSSIYDISFNKSDHIPMGTQFKL